MIRCLDEMVDDATVCVVVFPFKGMWTYLKLVMLLHFQRQTSRCLVGEHLGVDIWQLPNALCLTALRLA